MFAVLAVHEILTSPSTAFASNSFTSLFFWSLTIHVRRMLTASFVFPIFMATSA